MTERKFHKWERGDTAERNEGVAHSTIKAGYRFKVAAVQGDYLHGEDGINHHVAYCDFIPPETPITLPEGVRKVNARLPDGTPIVAGMECKTVGGGKVFVLGVAQYAHRSQAPVSGYCEGEVVPFTESGTFHTGGRDGDLISVWKEPDPVRHEWRNVYATVTVIRDSQAAAMRAEAERRDTHRSGPLHREHWTVNTITGESTLIEVDGVPV